MMCGESIGHSLQVPGIFGTINVRRHTWTLWPIRKLDIQSAWYRKHLQCLTPLTTDLCLAKHNVTKSAKSMCLRVKKPDAMLLVIQSWLYQCRARVAVGGKFSRDMKTLNMVYQGTVLGPPLWNIYYADAAIAVKLHGFLEIVFADDLNCYKDFGLSTANSKLHAQMRQCQGELHKWGRANQVSFDPSKESMHVFALQRCIRTRNWNCLEDGINI